MCENVQQKVNVVHVWLCRCVTLEGSCLCCASIDALVLVSRKWSQRWWDTHICSDSYVQGYMHRHTCVPSTRLTLLLGPVKLRPMWRDLWYAGVQPGVHGHKCVHIPGLEPMENGGTETIMLVCPWKSRCRGLGCGSTCVLACPHMLV